MERRQASGSDGELVERLTTFLRMDVPASRRWPIFMASIFISALGGSLEDVDLVDFDADGFPDAVEARLGELIDAGVDEGFLVAALVREIDEYLHHVADAGIWAHHAATFRELVEKVILDDNARQQLLRGPLAAGPTVERMSETWAVLEVWRSYEEDQFPEGTFVAWGRSHTLRSTPANRRDEH